MPAGSERAPEGSAALGVLVWTVGFGLFACGLFGAGGSRRRVLDHRPVLERGSGGLREDLLRDAIQTVLDRDEDPPGTVSWVYQWRPQPGLDVVVWLTCRGPDGSRACAVSTGRLDRGRDGGPRRLRVMGYEGTGWGNVQLGESPDRATLVMQGDDGRGFWRQTLRYTEENGGNVVYSRRNFSDGLP